MKRAKKRHETERKALSLSNGGCPRCRMISSVLILRAGRDVAAAEGWVEVRCVRCETEWRIVPIHPDEEARQRREGREQAEAARKPGGLLGIPVVVTIAAPPNRVTFAQDCKVVGIIENVGAPAEEGASE